MRLRPHPVWIKTFALLALLAVSLLGIDQLFGRQAALYTGFSVLLLLWLRDRRYLVALWNWVKAGRGQPLPSATGLWDTVFAGLHRHARNAVAQRTDLIESLSSFRNAIQALPEGVVTLDAQNRIVWCNVQGSEHLGLRVPGDAGQNIVNLLRSPEFLAYLAHEEWDKAVQVRVGKRLLSLHLTRYGAGEKLLLSKDVTQLERLETMRRDFVANVSHELKTPLTVFTGFLETIRELPLSPDQTGQYLNIMAEQAQRMQGLLTDLLTLSALEADNTPAEARIDMSAVLATLASTAEQLSGGRHHIELEIASGLDLLGSESEIISALGNLVSNAVRYTPPGGRVTIRWEALEGPEGSAARFSVIDTGIGISPQHLPRLTERFYRVDASRSRESGGTGLGLAIVKHVLTRHESRLDIHSKPGAGSRFSAEFPARRILRAPAKTAVKTDASTATREQFAQPH